MNKNCEEFRAQWSDWHAGALDEATAEGCANKRAQCGACARYDRQMRRLLNALGTLPFPDEAREVHPRHRAPAPLAARAGRRRSRALATTAAIVIAFGAGLLVANLQPRDPGMESGIVYADAVSIRQQATEDIQIALAAPRRIERVEFTVELPPGVELDGYPGQRVVRWQGQLKPGRSRLTLPVRATNPNADAELIARIRHEDGTRELRVPLRMATGTRGPAAT